MNQNRKVFSRFLSAILVLVICITTVFGSLMSVSAATDYEISGVNVVYEDNGTMSVNVHIPNVVQGEKLVITKTDGTASKHPDIDGSTVTDSTATGYAMPDGAKMYTIKGLSATDLADTLVFTRVVGETKGASKNFTFEDYAVSVIKEQDVQYPENTTDEQKTADKEMAASFANYVVYASKALSSKNGASADEQLDAAITEQLDKTLYDRKGNALLASWREFSADNTQFVADEFVENDPDLTVYGTGLNLKGNPYLLITFAITGEYELDKENVVATFTAGDQTISVKGSEMTNNTGAGRYHLVRLKGITVNNLCKDVDVSVTYNGTEVLYGTFGVDGFVNSAIAAQMEAYSLVGKSILYYCNVIDARNVINIQSAPTAFAVYGESFDTEGNSLGMSLNFYNQIVDNVGSEITFDGGKQTVTELYSGINIANTVPWSEHAAEIEQVKVIDDGVAPNKVDYWFDGFTACKTIDLAKLDTSKLADMSTMLIGCTALDTLTLGEKFGTADQTLADTGINKAITGFTKASENNATDYYCDKITLGTAETYTAATYCYATAWFQGMYTNPYLSLYQRKYVPQVSEYFEGYTVRGVYSWRGDTVSNGCYTPKTTAGEPLQSWNEPKPLNSNYGKLTDGIEKVIVVDEIAPQSLSEWFSQFSICKEFDLKNLDVTAATSMYRMFFSCSKVTQLDLSSFDTQSITRMTDMFRSCINLKAIFVTDKFVANASSSSNMFYNCAALEGGNGTKWDAEVIDKTYAFIDGVNGVRGYLTAVTHKHNVEEWLPSSDTTHTGICTVYNEPITEEHIFVSGECKCGATQNVDGDLSVNFAVYGESFDADGNSLGNSLYFYNRIANIGSEIILDDGSRQTVTEIYTGIAAASTVPWSERAADIKQVKVVDHGVAPNNINYWFEGFTACTDIDLAKLDTSNVVAMSTLFSGCSELETLTLGKKFGTANQTLADTGIDKFITGFTKASEENKTDHYCSQIALGTAETYTAATYCYATKRDNSNTMYIYQRKYVPKDNERNFNDGVRTYTVVRVYAWRNGHKNNSNYTVSEGGFAPRNYADNKIRETWHGDTLTPNFKTVEAIDYIAPQTLDGWFYHFYNLGKDGGVLDLSKLDTSNITDMNSMFYDCNGLTSIDLSSFDTSNVTNMDNMFHRCSTLKTITVSDKFVTDSVESSANMFTGCKALVGGNGTTLALAGNVVDKTYACIDTAQNKGYFTAKR